MPSRARSTVITAEELVEMLKKKTRARLVRWGRILPTGKSYRGELVLTPEKEITFEKWIETPMRYILGVRYASGAEFGGMKVFLNAQEVGTIGVPVPMGICVRSRSIHIPLRFREGTNLLKFARVSGGKIGISSINLKPVFSLIRDWYVIAPFENPNLKGGRDVFSGKASYQDGVFPPEREINFNAVYGGWRGIKAVWRKLHSRESVIDLGEFFCYEIKKLTSNPRGPKILGYAFTYIHCPKECNVSFRVDRLDWYIKVFVNRKLVHTHLSGHYTGYFTAKLRRQRNEFVVKLVPGSNSWTLSISLANPDELKLSLPPPEANRDEKGDAQLRLLDKRRGFNKIASSSPVLLKRRR